MRKVAYYYEIMEVMGAYRYSRYFDFAKFEVDVDRWYCK